MRNLALTWFAIGLVACRYEELPRLTGDAHGSDGPMSDATTGDSGDAPTDAMHVCYTPADIASGTAGTVQTPLMREFFYTPTSGPNANQKTFNLGLQLNQEADVIILEVTKPAGGYVVNQAYPFVTDPALVQQPYIAISYLYGDLDVNSFVSKQYLWATNGSITFTAIGEASGSNINGTVTMTDYLESDEGSGTFVNNGCRTKLAGLTFNLREM